MTAKQRNPLLVCRRLQIYKVSVDHLAEVLCSGKWVRVLGDPDYALSHKPPVDAKLVGCEYDEETRSLHMTFEHPDFTPMNIPGMHIQTYVSGFEEDGLAEITG